MTSLNGPTPEAAPSIVALRDLDSLRELKTRAYVDPFGKLAWTKEDAPEAARRIAEAGLAIIRVNVWCLCPGETYATFFPFVDDKYHTVEWVHDIGWTPETESWEAFCRRCYEAALPFLTDNAYEERLTPEWGPSKMRRYIEAVREEDYWSA